RRATSSPLAMKDFDLFLAKLRDLHVFDESDDLPERAVDPRNIRTNLADSEYRPLPQVMPVTLRDGNVERIGHTGLDPFDDATLAFQRVILRQEERELENTDHHDWSRS